MIFIQVEITRSNICSTTCGRSARLVGFDIDIIVILFDEMMKEFPRFENDYRAELVSVAHGLAGTEQPCFESRNRPMSFEGSRLKEPVAKFKLNSIVESCNIIRQPPGTYSASQNVQTP